MSFMFLLVCILIYFCCPSVALIKDDPVTGVGLINAASAGPQQLGPDLVAVIGHVLGLSIFIRGSETRIPSLADQRCHAVAYARNGPLFVATDRKIFRLDASVGLPIDAGDGGNIGGGASGSGDSGRAHVIIADHVIQALAVDDIGRKIYWVTNTDLTDAIVSALKVDDYHGSDRRTLLRLPANHVILSRTLAVDSVSACILFFVDVQSRDAPFGQKQLHIRRLDGRVLGIVQRISEADEISAVAIDTENSVIYWMESISSNSVMQVRGLSYLPWLTEASASPTSPSSFALLDIPKDKRPARALAYQQRDRQLYWIQGVVVVACDLAAAGGAAGVSTASVTSCRATQTRLRVSELPYNLVVLSKSEYKAWPAAYKDICATRNPCDHLCFRRSSTAEDQRYTCLCRNGLLPDPRNNTHRCLTSYVDYMLISLDVSKGSSVLKMSLDTEDYHSTELFQVHKFIVKCLAVDPLANVVYWIDYQHEKVSSSGSRASTEAIRRVALLGNGAGPVRFEKILENADEVPVDLAVDWSSGNLYWATQRKLLIARLDGRHQYVLASFDKITAVKLDPIRGYLYYCADSRLVQSHLDGVSQLRILLNLTSSHFCQLVVDEATGDLYYLADPQGRLGVFQFSADGATSAHIQLTRAVASVSPSVSKVYSALRGHLYWLSISGDMSLGIVDRNGANSRELPVPLRIPLSLAASSARLAEDFAAYIASNPCRRPDNAGCEQLCIPRPDLTAAAPANRRVCRCASHFQLADSTAASARTEAAEDGQHRCQSLRTFLVVASGRDIGMATPRGLGSGRGSVGFESLHLSNDLRSVEFVASDASRGRICWAEAGRHIACAGLDRGAGVSAKVVVPGLSQPLGLAVDWATNVLFYIDRWPWPRLCAVSLDQPSLSRTLLASDRLAGARALVFDSNLFRLFWIDINYQRRGRLQWLGFGLPDSPPQPVFQRPSGDIDPGLKVDTGTVLDGLDDPRHLTLDQVSRRLFFSDGKSLKSVNYYGQDVRSLPLSFTPIGVAFHGWAVYYVALNSRRIHRVGVSPVTGEFIAEDAAAFSNASSASSTSADDLPRDFRPVGLVLFDTDSVAPPDAASALKTRLFCSARRCPHFCLLTNQLKITCACADSHRLANDSGAAERCERISDWLHLVTDKGITVDYALSMRAHSLRNFTVSHQPDLPGDIVRAELLLPAFVASDSGDSPPASMYFLYLQHRGSVLLHNPASSAWHSLVRGHFLDMALDPVNRLLYLAEETAIVAYRLEDRQAASSTSSADPGLLPVEAAAVSWLIRNCSLETCRPVALALDPVAGALYWLNRDLAGGNHLLHRCRLDGTGEVRLPVDSKYLAGPPTNLRFYAGEEPGLHWTSNLGGAGQPNWALLMLPAGPEPASVRRLLDRRQLIQCASSSSKSSSTSVCDPPQTVSLLNSPVGLGLGAHHAYMLDARAGWISVSSRVDARTYTTLRLPEQSGSDRLSVTTMVLANISERLWLQRSVDATACRSRACSHICLPPEPPTLGLRCACPSGWELSNPPSSSLVSAASSTALPVATVCRLAPFACGNRQFTCRRRRQCVPLSALCNGRPDCHDASDEACCGAGAGGLGSVDSLPCRAEKSNGGPQCLPLRFWCDGSAKCSDASDRTPALCSEARVISAAAAEAVAAAAAAATTHPLLPAKPTLEIDSSGGDGGGGGGGGGLANVMSGHGVFIYLLVPLLIGAVVLLPLLGYCCTRDKPALRLHLPEMAELRPLPPRQQPQPPTSASSTAHRLDLEDPDIDVEDDRIDDDEQDNDRLRRNDLDDDISSLATSAAAAARAAAAAATGSTMSSFGSQQQQQQLCEYVETLNPPPSPCTDCSSLPGAAAAAARFQKDFEDCRGSGSGLEIDAFYPRARRRSSGGDNQQHLLLHNQQQHHHHHHRSGRRRRKRQRSRSKGAAAAAASAGTSGASGSSRRPPVALIAPPYDSPYHQHQHQQHHRHRQHRSGGGGGDSASSSVVAVRSPAYKNPPPTPNRVSACTDNSEPLLSVVVNR